MAWTIRDRSRYEAEPTKGSRFVAHLAPVSDETAAKGFLGEVAAEFPDASHHCWAWRLDSPSIERAGDDGEPSGSAGRPILAQLTGRNVIDVAVVVSRWFGGTKLGVGGLVRAYGGAAGEALERAASVPWLRLTDLVVVHGHEDANAVERVLSVAGAVTTNVSWASDVTRSVTLPEADVESLWAALANATRGRVQPPTQP